MIERVARGCVVFATPFYVEGLDREQAAGTYEVETVEELIEGLSFLAYRIASMSILLPQSKGATRSYQLVRIEPSVVRAAQREGESTDECL